MEKEFKTIEEQIEILKSRKLIIKDEEFAKKIFKENNYYYVINGYKNLFVQEINGEEFYKFYKVLIEDIEELNKNINSLEPDSILSIMGFPENYQDLIKAYKDI